MRVVMQFVDIAWDGTDREAPGQRAAARPTHLEEIRSFVDRGNIAVGGADGSLSATPT
jgi:hypothetical protein